MRTKLLFLSFILASSPVSAFSREFPEDCIKVRFLGTGAADWKGREKSSEYRRFSSILVDDAVLVDFTASNIDMLPDGIRPEAIFYTHSHSDHFDPVAALRLGVRRVYVSGSWIGRAKESFGKAASSIGVGMPLLIPLDVQEEAVESGLTFKALPANHSTGDRQEQALIYLIEKDGVRLLYATDTGGLLSDAVSGAGLDAQEKGCPPLQGLIMEATMSADEDYRMFTHSSVGTVLHTANVLQKTGRYTPAEGQPVYLTHLARTLHGTRAELEASLPRSLKAAYDGLEIVFTGTKGSGPGKSGQKYSNRAAAIAAQIHNPESRYVVVVSHRGDWRNFPENSIPAIESVIRYGADIMELDLKMTKDSVLVLSHDGNVLRCTNFRSVFKDEPEKSPRIKDLTYAEIQRLSLLRAHGAVIDTLKMPTLRQALECCRDRICVNVDQGYEFYDQVLSITEELGVTDQILIKGKKPIEVVAQHEAEYEHNMMYMPIVDIQRPSGKKLLNSYFEQNVVPLAYEVCWQTDDGTFEEVCRRIVSQGSKVWVNTIWASLCGGDGNDDDAAFLADDPGSVYQRYLDDGVSMIQTDRPELLVKWLQSRGRHTLE